MDVKLLSKIVRDLLPVHGRVVLPGFGVFAAEDVPAYFSDKGFTLNPPYRKVVFSPVIEKDTLFRDCYCKANNVEAPQADRMLQAFFKQLKSDLQLSKVVVLPDFGKLRATRDGKIFFIEDENLSIFPHYDFLESIALKSLDPAPAESLAVDFPIPAAPTGSSAHAAPTGSSANAGATSDANASSGSDAEDTRVEASGKSRKHSARWVLVLFIVIVILAVLFFASLAVAGRLYPELVDPFLYTPEELEILRLP